MCLAEIELFLWIVVASIDVMELVLSMASNVLLNYMQYKGRIKNAKTQNEELRQQLRRFQEQQEQLIDELIELCEIPWHLAASSKHDYELRIDQLNTRLRDEDNEHQAQLQELRIQIERKDSLIIEKDRQLQLLNARQLQLDQMSTENRKMKNEIEQLHADLGRCNATKIRQLKNMKMSDETKQLLNARLENTAAKFAEHKKKQETVGSNSEVFPGDQRFETSTTTNYESNGLPS